MEINKLMIKILTTFFDKTEEDVSKILFKEGEDGKEELNEKAFQEVKKLDSERIKVLKAEKTEAHDNGYKKAEKEFKGIAEKTFIEATGYKPTEDDEKLDAMVKNWSESQKKSGKVEVTDDIVKKHPVYLELEKTSVPKEKFTSLETEFNNFKNGAKKNETMSIIKRKAWDIVSGMKPVLSENEVVSSTQKDDFLSKLGQYDYEVSEDDILIMKGGKRLEDDHANRITFDKMISEMASKNFDFKKGTDGGSAGNNNDGKGGKSVSISEKPTTKAELNKALDKYSGNTEDDAKKRIALSEYYDNNRTD